MQEQLENILREAHEIQHRIRTPQDLEQFRVRFLGRNGMLRTAAAQLGELSDDERRTVGQYFNYVKTEVEKVLADLEARLHQEERIRFDFRHPGRKSPSGHRHLLSQTLVRIRTIFTRLGFDIADSPLIVTEYDNFDSVNIPPNHPARDMWDTLWVRDFGSKERYLFRTHTSAYQVRYLQQRELPVRAVFPGEVFRHEATDRTHEFDFAQLEGLAVGAGANLAELRGVLKQFFSDFFGRTLAVRFRTSYFPFVEPGLEVDLECLSCCHLGGSVTSGADNCNRRGCAVCKGGGFIEVAGAGMVHPAVLREAGLNPREQTGYAFGFGVERLAMLRHRIDDIRLFRSGDLRFIRQF